MRCFLFASGGSKAFYRSWPYRYLLAMTPECLRIPHLLHDMNDRNGPNRKDSGVPDWRCELGPGYKSTEYSRRLSAKRAADEPLARKNS